jgi:hypothetical protein
MSATITTDEWLAELERVYGMSSEGATRREIANQLGVSLSWVLVHVLRPGVANGTILVGRRSVTRIDDHACSVPVYRFAGKPEQTRTAEGG